MEGQNVLIGIATYGFAIGRSKTKLRSAGSTADDALCTLLMKRSPPIAQGGGLFCGFVISPAAPPTVPVCGNWMWNRLR